MVDEPRTHASQHLDIEASATLRKWPSVKGERLPSQASGRSYLIFEGTLNQCIRQLNEKPASARRLYEIEIALQSSTVVTVLSADDVQRLGW